MYNEREDAWPTSPTEFCLVTPRSDACAAAINGKLYVAGGQSIEARGAATNPHQMGQNTLCPLSDSFESNRQFSCLPNPLPCKRLPASLGGGVAARCFTGGYGSGRSELSSIEEGDPATGAWRKVGDLPTRRGDVACATVGGLLYVAGGYFDPTGACAAGA